MSVLYGADAVYLAGTDFGMRSFAGNFTPEEMPKAVEFAHSHGVKVHVTVNTMPRNDEVVQLPAYLEQLQDAGVDALIVADMGAFTLAGKYAPKCERHISTPGQESLNAAVMPNETDYSYYALNPATGEHQFSKTYKEHLKFLDSLE